MPIKSIDGKPVIDAKKPLTIKILDQDVKSADVKKPNSCAVAQTCLRMPGVKEVRIHLSRAYIRTYIRTNDSNWQRFLVPKELRTEIIAFDRGGRFVPGDYKLDRPSPANKLGGARGGTKNKTTPYNLRKKREASKGYKKRGYHVLTDVRLGPA